MDTRSLWKWNHSPVKNLSLHLPGYSIGCSLHRHRQATCVSVWEIEPTAPSWLRLQKSHPFSEGTVPLRDIISKGNTRCPVQRCTQFQKNNEWTKLWQLYTSYVYNTHPFQPSQGISSYLFPGPNQCCQQLCTNRQVRRVLQTWIKYIEAPWKAPSLSVPFHSEHRPLSYWRAQWHDPTFCWFRKTMQQIQHTSSKGTADSRFLWDFLNFLRLSSEISLFNK